MNDEYETHRKSLIAAGRIGGSWSRCPAVRLCHQDMAHQSPHRCPVDQEVGPASLCRSHLQTQCWVLVEDLADCKQRKHSAETRSMMCIFKRKRNVNILFTWRSWSEKDPIHLLRESIGKLLVFDSNTSTWCPKVDPLVLSEKSPTLHLVTSISRRSRVLLANHMRWTSEGFRTPLIVGKQVGEAHGDLSPCARE